MRWLRLGLPVWLGRLLLTTKEHARNENFVGNVLNNKAGLSDAKQMTTNVGGNLNMESRQDTAIYAEKNQQAVASGMIGAGGSVNFSKSSINSYYAAS